MRFIQKVLVVFSVLTVFNQLIFSQSAFDCTNMVKSRYLDGFPLKVSGIIDKNKWVKCDDLSVDFAHDTLDRSKWEVYNNFCHPMSGYAYFVDNDKTVFISDSCLNLKINKIKDPANCANWLGSKKYNYISGYIQSIKPVKYGLIEIECYIPKSSKMCPSFWLFADKWENGQKVWYDEIDILEMNNKKYIMQNLHRNIDVVNENYERLIQHIYFGESYRGKWAVYGIEWSKDKIDFYVNGVLTSSVVYNHKSEEVSVDNDFSCIDISDPIAQRIQVSFSLTGKPCCKKSLNDSFKIRRISVYKSIGQDCE